MVSNRLRIFKPRKPAVRILHLPHNIGNNVFPLSFEQRRRNFESDLLGFEPHIFGYPQEFLLKKSSDSSHLSIELNRLKWFIKIISNYDILHFHFGQTLATLTPVREEGRFPTRLLSSAKHMYLLIFQAIELRTYRFMGKKMYFHFQGDDARTGDSLVTSNPLLFSEVPENYYSPRSDKFKIKQIQRFSKFANRFYFVNPDLYCLLPSDKSTFLPYSNLIDRVSNTFADESRNNRLENRKLRICHAPSNKALKGSRFIIEVLENICSKNEAVEFILVENTSHEEALEIYRACDLYIDQLLCGWYGAVAVENMTFGIPVMALISDYRNEIFPPDFREDLPIIQVSIDSLEKEILEFIEKPIEFRRSIGAKGIAFVNKWHTAAYGVSVIEENYRLGVD